MTREPGFYWVKVTYNSKWSPQFFNGSKWEVCDYDIFLGEHCIHEINETRMKSPDEG